MVQDGQSGKDGVHDRRRFPRASRQWHAISTGAGELLLALVALVLVILPQVLVPGRLREGPPLIMPVIEATVFPYCWRRWRNPGRSRAPPVR